MKGLEVNPRNRIDQRSRRRRHSRTTPVVDDEKEGIEREMADASAMDGVVANDGLGGGDAMAVKPTTEAGEARMMTDSDADGGRRRRGRGSTRRDGRDESPRRRNSGRVSVLDRLGATNRRGDGFKRGGRPPARRRGDEGRDGGPRRPRFGGGMDHDGDGRRGRFGRDGPPPRPPREPRPDPCEVVKREDGVVVGKAFGAELIHVSPEGAVYLSRPLDASGAPRSDNEVLNAFNFCLNKIGIKLSASPADQTAWSISDGKRLSRFHDGVLVPAPVPPGPGRGLAMMMTAPVGGGASGGGGHHHHRRPFGRGRGYRY